MPTDHEISILADIASSGGPAAGAIGVLGLIADGYVEVVEEASRYQLIREGQCIPDDRGVGANES